MSEESGAVGQPAGTSTSSAIYNNKPPSPDDLLGMYEQEIKSEKENLDKEVTRQAKIKEELPKKIVANKVTEALEEKEKALVKSQLSANAPIDSEDSAEKEQDGEESKENDQEQEEEKLLNKAFKAKFNDEELDIPEEAVIPVTINNKNVEVKVKDAIRAFTEQEKFNRDITRRLAVADNREKKIQTEYQGIKNKVRAVIGAATSGDFMGPVKALAKLGGIDSELDQAALERALLDQLEKDRLIWGKWDNAQREVYFANSRAEELAKENEAIRAETERSRVKTEIQQEIQQMCAEYELPQESFWELYQELAAEAVGEGKRWQSANEIQPVDVVNYHQQVEAVKSVNEILAEEKAGGLWEQYGDDLDRMINLSIEQGLSRKQIKEVTKDLVQTIKSKATNQIAGNLNKKLEKSGKTAQGAPTNSANKQRKEGENLADPEYLAWLNRNAPRSSKRIF